LCKRDQIYSIPYRLIALILRHNLNTEGSYFNSACNAFLFTSTSKVSSLAYALSKLINFEISILMEGRYDSLDGRSALS
jgi:hypothetical protein